MPTNDKLAVPSPDVLDALPEGVAILDARGTILYCNRAFAGLAGVTPASLLSKPFGEQWTGRSAQEILVDALSPEGAVESFVLPNGHKRAVFVRFIERPAGHLVVAHATSADRVTALQAGDDRYRQILHSVRVIPWELDLPELKFTYVGPQAPSILGYSAVSWTEPGFLRMIIGAGDDQRVVSILDEAARSHEERELEFRVHDLHGSIRILRGEAIPVGSNGTTVRGFFLDVTELYLAQEEKRLLEQRMLQAQKLESLGLLAGGIAHDFNNYLMAILGNAGLALMELDESQKSHRYVSQIEKAGARASELTRELLMYSGRRRPEFQIVRISELVREMPELLQTVISKRAVVQYQISMHLPEIEADPSQLRQVIMNLITNASEALGGNSGIITIRTGFSTLADAPQGDAFLGENLHPGKYVYFEVSDTGCGMDEDTRRRIFDPFFTTKPKGRGLGLASVLGIVRAHRGGLIIDSRKGEGTTFRVLFPPAGRIAYMEENTPIPIPGKPSGRGMVLVVDDETSVVEIATSILHRAGYQVAVARTGRQAIDIFRARSEEVRAVVLDIIMPELNGDEAFRQIRAIRPDVPVLFSSGYHDTKSMPDLSRERHTAFIDKPYRPRELQDRLAELLDDSHRSHQRPGV